MTRHVWILALVAFWAVLAASGPARAGEGHGHGIAVASGASGAGGAPAGHHCSHADAEPGPGPAGDESGDCCPDGCDACPSCTGGVSALHGTRVAGPPVAAVGPGGFLLPQRGPASADLGGIYHPPRA